MYHGIAQDDLNNFLAVAEDLKVKGLAQANSDSLSNITSSGHKVKLLKWAKDRPSSTLAAMDEDDIHEVASVPIKQEIVTVKTLPGAGYQKYAEAGDMALATATEYGEEQYYGSQAMETVDKGKCKTCTLLLRKA